MSTKCIKFLLACFAAFLLSSNVTYAQELPPGDVLVGQSYLLDDGTLFKDTLYISGFNCLVTGHNISSEPACEYYRAKLSKNKSPKAPSKNICFKESTRISYPRIYSPHEIHRLAYVTAESREHLIPDEKYYSFNTQKPVMKPYPVGQIISETPISDPIRPSSSFHETKKWNGPPRYPVTEVVLYNCSTPYDGKSYN